MRLVVEIPPEELAEVTKAIAARVAELIAPPPAEVVTGHTAKEYGISRRRFLDLARTGQIPSFREGKKTCARRCDVLAWLAARQGTPFPSPEPRDATVDEIVQRALESGRLHVVKGGRK
jgi:hypothetical protein